MDVEMILSLVKSRLGISSTVRDIYLTAITNSVIKELEDEKKLILESANYNHIMFIVDYVSWRYQNKDSDGGMPRHIQFRMHNLIIHNGGDAVV
jgi:hypothetical protein